jgi:hypothetical protein
LVAEKEKGLRPITVNRTRERLVKALNAIDVKSIKRINTRSITAPRTLIIRIIRAIKTKKRLRKKAAALAWLH